MLWQCPKLTPLQSRFLASVVALAILGVLYWTLSDAHFAYAAELEFDGSGQQRGEDHNWYRIAQESLEGSPSEDHEGTEGIIGSTTLTARAPSVSRTGGNNVANNENIQPGNTTVWMFPRSQLLSAHAETGPGLPDEVKLLAHTDQQHVDLRKRALEDDVEISGGLSPRQTARTIYISINTCLQPTYIGSGMQTGPPPQLTLYVSTTKSNANPGPGNDDNQREIPLEEGFASTLQDAEDDWYISVHAPSLPNNFTGVWNYELAVSIDGYFHSAELNNTNLFLLDSDSVSALLVTNNLTQANVTQPSYQEWMDLTAPYIVFANNAEDTSTMGISNSYCGLNKTSKIVGRQIDPTGDSTNVQMQMTHRGLGHKPKEQFYVTALNRSSKYSAVLARVGNSTNSGDGVVGGGGKVWQTMTFPTKSDGNCALLFNLSFCEEVAYAVPSTPDFVSDFSKFRSFYDDYTLKYYQLFNYSMQQVSCNTTADARYSLARNCHDCHQAYKEWLCAVSIPRCEDFSNTAQYLQPRNVGQAFYNNNTFLPEEYLNKSYTPMPRAPTLEGTVAFSQTHISSKATNSSRNPKIDEVIRPGPYKEVLPCDDLCYGLVQSCPAALGFGCPYPGRGLEVSYGTRHGNGNGTITCSYLGAYVYTNGAGSVFLGLPKLFALALLAAWVFMV